MLVIVGRPGTLRRLTAPAAKKGLPTPTPPRPTTPEPELHQPQQAPLVRDFVIQSEGPKRLRVQGTKYPPTRDPSPRPPPSQSGPQGPVRSPRSGLTRRRGLALAAELSRLLPPPSFSAVDTRSPPVPFRFGHSEPYWRSQSSAPRAPPGANKMSAARKTPEVPPRRLARTFNGAASVLGRDFWVL